MAEKPAFQAPISEEIWKLKYRFVGADGAGEASLDETFWRVARAAVATEKGDGSTRERWAREFHDAMADFGFLPGGRILAGAGTGRAVTLFNCFVMGRIEDDLGSIFENVKEAALTMQQGGGIGHDFSTLRPKRALVKSIGADASGPVSFMDVWDAMCRTIMSAGARRGAMMGTLRCDHPDIEAFIDVKSDPVRLRNFNLSVLVTDLFMVAVKEDKPWDLVFEGKVYRTLPARDLWNRIMRAAYDYAEPGVIFIDRINRQNNLAYCESIQATNPCGEQPLPPYGACLLGSINLAAFVADPFTPAASINLERIARRVATAVRFLDNVIDISTFPLPAQRREAQAKRRLGLGVTGLADALIMVGARYGSERAQALAGEWMAEIERVAYRASAEIAAEKGAFPLFDAERFLASPNVARLSESVRTAIATSGIRNGCITSIAPTGTISLLAGNVSSGVEPVFDFTFRRRVLEADGTMREENVEDFAHAQFRRLHGAEAPLPEAFVATNDLAPHEHLEMQAALQRHVDSSISKTINCPADIAFETFKDIYEQAYALGLKGCTAFRPNPVTGAVLSTGTPTPAAEPVAVATPRSLPDVVGRPGDVVHLMKPLERDRVLAGYTYKIRWPGSDHAIYVTINDIEQGHAGGVLQGHAGGVLQGHAGGVLQGHAGGVLQGHAGGVLQKRRRPFEIFINTKNLEHYAWTVALTRMISAVFRRGGDVAFVAEELKAVFDPQGGRWTDGRYVPSLLAAIGEVIEGHMIRIGFLPGPSAAEHDGDTYAASAPPERRNTGRRVAGGRSCPRCASPEYVREGGCWLCRSCGFSRCG